MIDYSKKAFEDAARLLTFEAIRRWVGPDMTTIDLRPWRHHALGMLQRELTDDLRIHVWHPALRVFKGCREDGYRDVHDHRFFLVSYVAMGEIEDVEYEVVALPKDGNLLAGADGKPFLANTQAWEIVHAKAQEGLEPMTISKELGNVYAQVRQKRSVSAGQSYVVMRRAWHTTRVKEPTITLVHRSDFDDKPARVLGDPNPQGHLESGIVKGGDPQMYADLLGMMFRHLLSQSP